MCVLVNLGSLQSSRDVDSSLLLHESPRLGQHWCSSIQHRWTLSLQSSSSIPSSPFLIDPRHFHPLFCLDVQPLMSMALDALVSLEPGGFETRYESK